MSRGIREEPEQEEGSRVGSSSRTSSNIGTILISAFMVIQVGQQLAFPLPSSFNIYLRSIALGFFYIDVSHLSE